MNKTNVEKLLRRLLETKSEKTKLGCDVHARDLAVAIQVDDARPLRSQTMTHVQLLVLVRGLIAAGRRVPGAAGSIRRRMRPRVALPRRATTAAAFSGPSHGLAVRPCPSALTRRSDE